MARLAGVVAIVAATGSAASAQTTGLTAGRGMVFADIGFQGDLGGGVNSSGIGVVNGGRAEIDANSWGERYDAALFVRLGVAYNLSDDSQVLLTTHWEQAEADLATVGLLQNQSLQAKFSDYQGWGIDAGFRKFVPTSGRFKPFGEVAAGFVRIQQITADLTAQPNFTASNVPFYSDSWVVQYRFGGGFLTAFTDRIGLQVTGDVQYSGVLNDQSGLGQLGFERINNAGNRWSVPLTGGIYVKF